MRVTKAGKAVHKRIWEGTCSWCEAEIEDEEGSHTNKGPHTNIHKNNHRSPPFIRVNCPNCNTEVDLTLTKRVAAED